LIGLAGGAWIVGRKDRSARLRRTILVVEVITAVSLLLSVFVLNRIPALLISLGLKFQVSSWAGLLALQIISATLLILVPALLMGLVMPLVIVWASNQPGGAGRVGRSYAVNTIGAITGAFVTGFVLIQKNEHQVYVAALRDILFIRGRTGCRPIGCTWSCGGLRS
jgi:hypothetical protein